jgi:4-amino-4-deoxychorismate lyase
MLINGNRSDHIAVADRGLQYGDGLFETIAVVNGKPCLWAAHMQRLHEGCSRLGISFPGHELLLSEAQREIGQQQRCVLKIIVTRGAGGRGYRPPPAPEPSRILYTSPWPDYPESAAVQGVAVRICETRLGSNPALAGIKHLNRLEQVMAQAEWDDAAIAEGLMLDYEGRVIEGTMSNLFMLYQGELLTPDLTGCGTAGVMRDRILKIATSLGIEARIGAVKLEQLWEADALFLSNSLIGIWPIRQLDDQGYDPTAIPQALREAIATQGFTA